MVEISPISETTYPDMVYTFYGNLSRVVKDDMVIFPTKSRNVEMELREENFVKTFGFDNAGAMFTGSSSCEEALDLELGIVLNCIYFPGAVMGRRSMLDVLT